MFHVKHANGGVLEGVWKGSKGGLNAAKAPPERASGGLKGAGFLAAGLLIAACSAPGAEAQDAGARKPAAAAPAAPKPPQHTAAAKSEFADNAKQGTGDDAPSRDFAYSWPAAVSAVPELVTKFTAERSELLANQKSEWADALKDYAADECAGCVNRDFQKSWSVVTDLPRFLSLSATFYEYSGGAHGNHAYEGLVWDRTAKKAFAPEAMFRSEAALQKALGAAWCKGLKKERTARLGAEYADDEIFPCPPVKELTVLVGSSDRKSFNRIGLIAAPYIAGSYAEGDYELTFPVTPAVLAAVKPDYKAFFALGK